MLMMMTLLMMRNMTRIKDKQLLSLYFITGQPHFPFTSLSGSLKRWMGGIRLVDLRDGVQVPNGKPAELLMAKDYQTHIDNK